MTRRMVCVSLFVLANTAYGAVAVSADLDGAKAGVYGLVAVLWSLRIGHYRRRTR